MSAIVTSRKTSLYLRHFCSSRHEPIALSSVERLVGGIGDVDLNEFRQRAFVAEKPLLITERDGPKSAHIRASIPAARKWFSFLSAEEGEERRTIISQDYLSPFAGTIVPYELVNSKDWLAYIDNNRSNLEQAAVGQVLAHSDSNTFHQFNAPLSLFLQACNSTTRSRLGKLYIAQAQIANLPKQLQDDLPTPRIVKEAGRGDVYDANIWMGIPPIYTPLHKDPNPNLFVQLASRKRVRLFGPSIGSSIFRDVQQRIGQYSSASFRGAEMMEGPERDALEEAVWERDVTTDGFEAIVGPGDALFIPKGWWHSIRSVGTGVTASVNWWFR